MPTARSRANRKYNEKAYDRVSVMLPKGRKQAVEAFCREQGESVNGLINNLLKDRLGLTDDEWKAPPENTMEGMEEE